MAMLRIVHLFLYLELVTPILTYYIYDDSPSAGYRGAENSIGTYSKNEYGKKYYVGSYNVKQKKYNERMIDSHFNVRKMPITRFQLPSEDIKTHTQDNQMITEPPKQLKNPKVGRQGGLQQQNIKMKTQAVREYKKKPTKKSSEQHGIPKLSHPEYVPIISVLQGNKDFEPKASVVQVNVRKTQVSTDPQKLKLSNNRASSLLKYEQENHKRVPASIISEQKKSIFNERNSQVSRVLNEITQKIGDRRQRRGETRKRDTEQTHYNEVYSKAQGNIASDNTRKYIGKDKTIVKHHHKRNQPIGENRETNAQHDTPYALFYRMNPENVDHQAGYMLMGSGEEHPADDSNNDDKHLTSSHDEQNNYTNGNLKKITNTRKLHKRTKSF